MIKETRVITDRERQLGAIINAYNEVTEKLKGSHERLVDEVERLRGQIEKKDRELARRERLASLGEMAAGVAHEIRNPLAGIQLYASLLVKDLSGNPEPQRLAERISGAVRTLESIVGDILAFAGQARPQVSCVRLGEAMQECLELLKPSLSANQVTLHMDEEVGEYQVWVDSRQMQRAILNLLYNAVEAAGEHGWVRVSASRCSGHRFCKLEVSDSGKGIAPDLLNKVFDPFFTTRDSGTGLGLAIVHSFAETHGGMVSAANHEGGGAVFALTLPLGGE